VENPITYNELGDEEEDETGFETVSKRGRESQLVPVISDSLSYP
jgi:hypothetical protein